MSLTQVVRVGSVVHVKFLWVHVVSDILMVSVMIINQNILVINSVVFGIKENCAETCLSHVEVDNPVMQGRVVVQMDTVATH